MIPLRFGQTLAWSVDNTALGIQAAFVGAVLLSLRFVPEMGVGRGVYAGIFHSVSAFNNAGFDGTGGFRSIVPFFDSWPIVMTHAVLLILGGLGWAILGDLPAKRRWGRLALETKIVLLTSAALLVVGAVLFAAMEWKNPASLAPLTAGRLIDLGTDTPGELALTNTELNRFSTPLTLQLGDSQSGAITLSAAISQANHLSLTSGDGVSGAGDLTLTATKNLSIAASGAVNLTGVLTVSGTATIAASGHDVSLANAANDFTGAIGISARSISSGFPVRRALL